MPNNVRLAAPARTTFESGIVKVRIASPARSVVTERTTFCRTCPASPISSEPRISTPRKGRRVTGFPAKTRITSCFPGSRCFSGRATESRNRFCATAPSDRILFPAGLPATSTRYTTRYHSIELAGAPFLSFGKSSRISATEAPSATGCLASESASPLGLSR